MGSAGVWQRRTLHRMGGGAAPRISAALLLCPDSSFPLFPPPAFPFFPAGHGTQIEWDSLSDSAATVPVSCKRLNERDERVLLDPCMCNRPALLQLHCCPQRRVVEATHRATWLRRPSNHRTAVVQHPPLLCSAQPAAPLQGHLTCRPIPLLPLLPARSPQVVDDKWHAIFDGSAEGKTVRQVPGERGAGQHWGGGSRWWV